MWRNDGNAFVDVAPQLGMTGPDAHDRRRRRRLRDRRLRQRRRPRHLRPQLRPQPALSQQRQRHVHRSGQDARRRRREPRRRRRLGRLRQRRRPRPVSDVVRRPGRASSSRTTRCSATTARRASSTCSPRTARSTSRDHGVQLVDYDHDGGLDLTHHRGYTTAGRPLRLPQHDARQREAAQPERHGARREGAPDAFRRRSPAVRRSRARSSPRARCRPAAATTARAPRRVHFGLAKLEPVTVEVTFMTKARPEEADE